MAEETLDEVLALTRMHGRGVFPLPVKENPNSKEPTYNELPYQNADAPQKIKELKTFISQGPEVTSVDYAMRWRTFYPAIFQKYKTNKPSTTHELTFDSKNGFDEDYVYVSGMTIDMIARVNKSDPTKQDIFRFPTQNGRFACPHTLKFANIKRKDLEGMLWVGLEEQGRIVKLDMKKIMSGKSNKKTLEEGKPVNLTEDDFETICDVQIKGDTIPSPINTRPHGFCFDECYENIWFTGKLTNTVGRIGIDGTRLQHFELPTLGAVPIYIALGNDNNVWGTCLNSSIIFRVTTGEKPEVDELPISDKAKDRRPIAIKPDPRGRPFLWFSTEAGHSVCRLDTKVFEKELSKVRSGKTGNCTCSLACKFLFSGSKVANKIITEFPIPKVNRNMKLGGIAITKEGAIWTQSYVDPGENTIADLPDYVLRLRFDKHFPTITNVKERENKVNMTGVPIDYYELPTKNTVLHRIALAPDEDESVWFTELAADRVGTIKFKERVFTKRKKEGGPTTMPVPTRPIFLAACEKEDDDNEDGSRKKARTC